MITAYRTLVPLILLTLGLRAALALSACGSSAEPEPQASAASMTKLDPANFGDPATGTNLI